MLKKCITKVTVFLLRHLDIAEPQRTTLFEEVIDLLKKKLLSNEERQILTALFLERLGALPLHAKIKVDKTGRVVVNERPLDIDTAVRLKQAAVSMQGNAARNLVRETVTFMAIMDGVHKSVNLDMMLFAKAALWWLQEEDALYALLAQNEYEDE